jgi:EAL domain-containing protein (putative c-di-GMP-specific phosphodiesterase class I)
VLRSVCNCAHLWPSHLNLAVNLSPLQLQHDGLVESVREAIAIYDIDPRRLEFEITERVLLHPEPNVLQRLSVLHELGIQIVMDDFGAGYSSLGYLNQFKFDKIKIDRSFFSGKSGHRQLSSDIVRMIAALARSMDIPTVAEGIETAEQLRTIRELGCTHYQGFLFSKPQPIDSMVDTISNWAPLAKRRKAAR